MKKLIKFLFYILIINVLVSLLLILDVSSSKNNIHSDIIESLSNNDNYNLIVQILKDTNKEDFIRYIDYISIIVINALIGVLATYLPAKKLEKVSVVEMININE